jgi:hypothetical protein
MGRLREPMKTIQTQRKIVESETAIRTALGKKPESPE